MIGHTEVHFNHGLGGYRSCLCSCYDCMSQVAECICPDCSCRDDRFALKDHEPAQLEEVPKVVDLPLPEHPCSQCGKETARRGTRGRWPSKCMECK